MYLVCPSCTATNRIPNERLRDEPVCGKCGHALMAAQPVAISEQALPKFLSQTELPVLIDFWAAWCGPCRMVGPIIDEISEEYAGKAVIGKVDVDANQEFAAKYGVRNIPTVLIFQNGEVVGRQVGVAPKQTYADSLDALL